MQEKKKGGGAVPWQSVSEMRNECGGGAGLGPMSLVVLLRAADGVGVTCSAGHAFI